ncbi:SAM-dependent methyltransferase [Paenibacillus endophyticus]|uniref:SAM-dependent methyltransferase n=1 Tax=Paenibacillus endophyticus TaxID=1294268 RepID=A0A7W5C9Z8_9BACL|nr:class I SAM-dependent methyltransferase [Paenibacillus endophyticus]MBB3153887.1 SAM-dependent methyltransferase [Paenibacillus endophyticus]
MSSQIWPLSGLIAACPRCKAALYDKGGLWECPVCLGSYSNVEGSAYRLTLDDERESEHKDSVRHMFTTMHRMLETNGLSRFSTFVNWGYVALEDRDEPQAQAVHRNSVRLLREAIGDTCVKDKDVLEIACGRGGNVSTLCMEFEPKSVVGLDLTDVNVLFCQSRNRRENVYFCIGDAEMLPIGNACCDIVLVIEAADLFPNINRFYDEVYRVLKPGGTFVFADDLPLFKFEEGERYLRGLGFDFAFLKDITENVLLSSDLAGKRRYSTLQREDGMKDAVHETIGLPGTRIYDEMREGTRQYKLARLVKP